MGSCSRGFVRGRQLSQSPGPSARSGTRESYRRQIHPEAAATALRRETHRIAAVAPRDIQHQRETEAAAAAGLGAAQARLAAQGSDLSGSPLDVLGDLAAGGEEDALSLRYQAMRNAWDNRVRASLRPVPTGYYEKVPGGRVDLNLGIVRSLLG